MVMFSVGSAHVKLARATQKQQGLQRKIHQSGIAKKNGAFRKAKGEA
jgi:hypothetical protein